MAVHTVQNGDTLWGISRFYDVSIPVIKGINGLVSDVLLPGLNLYIPDRSLPERYYQVTRGDNFWQLAQRFDTSVPVISRANPQVNPYDLRVGQWLRIPTVQKYRMETLIFIEASQSARLTNKLRQIAKNLTYLAIFSYMFNPDGTLNSVNDAQLIKICKQLQIKPLMVVSNLTKEGFSPELAGQVLSSTYTRQALIQNIVSAVLNKGYAGVSIDFEFTPPALRHDFTSFLRELKVALGTRILHINAFAKTQDAPMNPISGSFDYSAIGAIVDVMTVLTYDYGYSMGPPDPIAPLWWVNEVLMYTTGQVDRRKLMMGIPLYGRDWLLPDTPEVDAKVLSVNRAQNQAIFNLVPIQYNEHAQSPWYRYTTNNAQHEVWFEDPRSVIAKYKLLEVYRLLGATYWQLAFDFPQNWAYLNKNIQVVK